MPDVSTERLEATLLGAWSGGRVHAVGAGRLTAKCVVLLARALRVRGLIATTFVGWLSAVVGDTRNARRRWRMERDADGRTFTVSGGVMSRVELDGEGRFFAQTFADAYSRVFGGDGFEEEIITAHGDPDDGKQALIDKIIATGHFDASDEAALRAYRVSQLEFIAERASARPKILRMDDYRMPGIEVGRALKKDDVRASERLQGGDDWDMPGIEVGKNVKASQEVRASDDWRMPGWRMPGIKIGGNR